MALFGWEAAMLIMYKGCELVPVKSDETWEVRIFSGGKLITTATSVANEDTALAAARKAVEGFRCGRRQFVCLR
jgi:hypothetical protein